MKNSLLLSLIATNAVYYKMSKATKRKHVTKEVMDDFILPDGDKRIVRIISSKGNNLHEVTTSDGEIFLASMPTKFRKNIWIKRDDYVIVSPIAEGEKVKAEIIHILYKPQILYIQSQGLWPTQFDSGVKNDSANNTIPQDMLPPSASDESSDSDNDVIGDTNSVRIENNYNPNRPRFNNLPENPDDSNDDSEDD